MPRSSLLLCRLLRHPGLVLLQLVRREEHLGLLPVGADLKAIRLSLGREVDGGAATAPSPSPPSPTSTLTGRQSAGAAGRSTGRAELLVALWPVSALGRLRRFASVASAIGLAAVVCFAYIGRLPRLRFRRHGIGGFTVRFVFCHRLLECSGSVARPTLEPGQLARTRELVCRAGNPGGRSARAQCANSADRTPCFLIAGGTPPPDDFDTVAETPGRFPNFRHPSFSRSRIAPVPAPIGTVPLARAFGHVRW